MDFSSDCADLNDKHISGFDLKHDRPPCKKPVLAGCIVVCHGCAMIQGTDIGMKGANGYAAARLWLERVCVVVLDCLYRLVCAGNDRGICAAYEGRC